MARDPEPAAPATPATPVSDAGVEHVPAPRARTGEDPGDSVDPGDLVHEPGDADEVG